MRGISERGLKPALLLPILMVVDLSNALIQSPKCKCNHHHFLQLSHQSETQVQ